MGDWDDLVGHGHNSLTIGKPSNKDVVLCQERVRKDNIFLGRASYTFEYKCSEGERITAVLAYDEWTDNTGGNARKISGGVGQQELSIVVTAQFNRGFHFKFIVYGKRQK